MFASSAPHEQVADFEEPSRASQRDSLASYHSTTSETGGRIAKSGSVGSDNSLMFGSYSSTTSSLSLTKTGSAGSVKKPPPPPKPKSLERGKTRGGRGSDPRPTSPPEGKKEEGDTNLRVNERVVPPKKPPRANRGSMKKDFAIEATEKTERGSESQGGTSRGGEEGTKRGEGGRGGEGGGGKVVSAVPPPKPARRHRSTKLTRVEQEPVSPQKKSLTMHPRSMSGGSQTPPNTSSSPAPRKPFPPPKPRSSQEPAEPPPPPPPPSLRESVAARLSEDGIDLTVPPYSTMVRGL